MQKEEEDGIATAFLNAATAGNCFSSCTIHQVLQFIELTKVEPLFGVPSVKGCFHVKKILDCTQKHCEFHFHVHNHFEAFPPT